MNRAKNLSDSNIERIVEILDGWRGKLRWELLIDEIEKRLFTRYTRQTLHAHARIANAFAHRKQELAGSTGNTLKRTELPELQLAFDRIERLTNECNRLKAENNLLLEQFVRWAYNAHLRGLDEQYLSQPLPDVNRHSDEPSKSRDLKSAAHKQS